MPFSVWAVYWISSPCANWSICIRDYSPRLYCTPYYPPSQEYFSRSAKIARHSQMQTSTIPLPEKSLLAASSIERLRNANGLVWSLLSRLPNARIRGALNCQSPAQSTCYELISKQDFPCRSYKRCSPPPRSNSTCISSPLSYATSNWTSKPDVPPLLGCTLRAGLEEPAGC